MLICSICERLPSLMSMAMLTWLFGRSVTLESTRTPYLPRE
jgi:hypothetical protein